MGIKEVGDLPTHKLGKPIDMYRVNLVAYAFAPVTIVAACYDRGHIVKGLDSEGNVYFADELVPDEDTAIARVRGLIARRIHAIKHMLSNAEAEYESFDMELSRIPAEKTWVDCPRCEGDGGHTVNGKFEACTACEGDGGHHEVNKVPKA